jgi:hypothetical protein
MLEDGIKRGKKFLESSEFKWYSRQDKYSLLDACLLLRNIDPTPWHPELNSGSVIPNPLHLKNILKSAFGSEEVVPSLEYSLIHQEITAWHKDDSGWEYHDCYAAHIGNRKPNKNHLFHPVNGYDHLLGINGLQYWEIEREELLTIWESIYRFQTEIYPAFLNLKEDEVDWESFGHKSYEDFIKHEASTTDWASETAIFVSLNVLRDVEFIRSNKFEIINRRERDLGEPYGLLETCFLFLDVDPSSCSPIARMTDWDFPPDPSVFLGRTLPNNKLLIPYHSLHSDYWQKNSYEIEMIVTNVLTFCEIVKSFLEEGKIEARLASGFSQTGFNEVDDNFDDDWIKSPITSNKQFGPLICPIFVSKAAYIRTGNSEVRKPVTYKWLYDYAASNPNEKYKVLDISGFTQWSITKIELIKLAELTYKPAFLFPSAAQSGMAALDNLKKEVSRLRQKGADRDEKLNYQDLGLKKFINNVSGEALVELAGRKSGMSCSTTQSEQINEIINKLTLKEIDLKNPKIGDVFRDQLRTTVRESWKVPHLKDRPQFSNTFELRKERLNTLKKELSHLYGESGASNKKKPTSNSPYYPDYVTQSSKNAFPIPNSDCIELSDPSIEVVPFNPDTYISDYKEGKCIVTTGMVSFDPDTGSVDFKNFDFPKEELTKTEEALGLKVKKLKEMVQPPEQPIVTPEKQERFLPLPEGIKWEDITITLSSNEHIKVSFNHKEKRFTYGELGFTDGRKGDQPTKLWFYLKEIIKHGGELSWEKIREHNAQLVKNVSRLNTHLKKQFGIKENIYTGHYRKKNADGMTGYQLRFTTKDNLKYKDKEENDDSYELTKLIKEQFEDSQEPAKSKNTSRNYDEGDDFPFYKI